MEEFCLSITNASAFETHNDWTFRSSMGVCRKLDYIIASRNLLVRASGPSDILNLGSNNRVVHATLT